MLFGGADSKELKVWSRGKHLQLGNKVSPLA